MNEATGLSKAKRFAIYGLVSALLSLYLLFSGNTDYLGVVAIHSLICNRIAYKELRNANNPAL